MGLLVGTGKKLANSRPVRFQEQLRDWFGTSPLIVSKVAIAFEPRIRIIRKKSFLLPRRFKTLGFHGLVNIVLPRTRLSISYFYGPYATRTLTSWTSKMATGSWYFLSFSALLDKFVQRELQLRHLDSLSKTKVFHQARHRTSGCYHDVRDVSVLVA